MLCVCVVWLNRSVVVVVYYLVIYNAGWHVVQQLFLSVLYLDKLLHFISRWSLLIFGFVNSRSSTYHTIQLLLIKLNVNVACMHILTVWCSVFAHAVGYRLDKSYGTMRHVRLEIGEILHIFPPATKSMGDRGSKKAYTGPRKFGCDWSIVVGCRSRNDRQTDKQNGIAIRLTLCQRDAILPCGPRRRNRF